MAGAAGRNVLIAGATSAMGIAATRALLGAGALVVAVGRDEARLAPLAELGARPEAADLSDEAAAALLASRLRADGVAIDGVLHLVGGWRGGGGLAGQSDADYRVLEASLTALRHVSRAFDEDLRRSPAGRLAIISSTAVDHPRAGGANYAAVKAASEAWVRAVADGYARSDSGREPTAAAVIFRVASLAGLEDAVADAYVRLWDAEAPSINGTTITVDTTDPDS
ncbi:SDR family oxidoreductase [Demequina sp. NBRC 110056]|uniref:SDR family NAD(P)-dependent oxidoreductase n=1 Tax=Demequina sp. NBRC 110056 TaxID=1570345 RepID=UPI000A05D646|nr:SDR family oxidoreductase [Demequina sp. NBRC 110056]